MYNNLTLNQANLFTSNLVDCQKSHIGLGKHENASDNPS